MNLQLTKVALQLHFYRTGWCWFGGPASTCVIMLVTARHLNMHQPCFSPSLDMLMVIKGYTAMLLVTHE